MNLRIFSLFLVLLLLTANCKDNDIKTEDDDNQDDDVTSMTFLVEFEPQEDNDLVEIKVIIQAQAYSLRQALKSASELVASVTQTVDKFCEQYPEDGANCEEAVDIGDFEISANYERVRRQQKFVQFAVEHQIVIKVYSTKNIGQLADHLIKLGVTKIQSFQWASTEEDDSDEGAIEAGQKKSHEMCFHLGMKLNKIVTIESVEQEQEEGDKQQDQEQQQQQESPIVYKFEIECILDEETAREKAKEEAEEDRLEKEEKEKEEEKQQQQEEEKKSKKKGKKDKEKEKEGKKKSKKQ